MSKKVKLDPNKIEYDGSGFRVVIKDLIAFNSEVARKMREVHKGPILKKDIQYFRKLVKAVDNFRYQVELYRIDHELRNWKYLGYKTINCRSTKMRMSRQKLETSFDDKDWHTAKMHTFDYILSSYMQVKL